MSQIDTENDKNLKIPALKDLMRFFPIFCRTLWIETLKWVNKVRMCCPVGF